MCLTALVPGSLNADSPVRTGDCIGHDVYEFGTMARLAPAACNGSVNDMRLALQAYATRLPASCLIAC